METKSEARLWSRSQQLPPNVRQQIEAMYNEHLLLETRVQLAVWIEENFALEEQFLVENASHQERGAALAQELLALLDARPDMADVVQTLRHNYGSNPLGLYMSLRQCLEQEAHVVSQSHVGDLAELSRRLKEQIGCIKQKVNETGSELDKVRQEQEAFSVEYYAFREKNVHFDNFVQQHGEQHADVKKLKTTKEASERAIKQKYLHLAGRRTALVSAYTQIYQLIKEVQKQVLDQELIKWKRDQQLAGNGQSMSLSLETLQEWCEGLAEVIWSMRQQARQLEGLLEKLGDPQTTNNLLPGLVTGITELLSNLVTGTFIIEKQPPQVMKTNTRFTATVRLLVGGVLNVHMAAPAVSVSIVSETQANQLLSSPSNLPKRKEDYSAGDIINGNGTMEFHSATKQVSVSFRNLQLKKIRRTEKKGTESVMDEKFSVLFWTEFQVGELKFQLWTLSLPVVVIVHGNQEPQALATVTWDNAFAEWGRRPFVVPDKVSWAQAGAALNMKWTAACGSPLTQDNLYYLACKAFRNNNIPKIPSEYNQMVLTWSQFCKEPLPDRAFTFWEWFYRILILTSNHMNRLWKEGFIMGFVSKQAAEALLLHTKKNGCFLLRFSDSELGGVTIGYLKTDHFQTPSVFNVAPFTTKDLSQRSMADVIFDLGDLTILYPDTPKEAFRKFCSSAQTHAGPAANGYVRHTLVTHVEGITSGSESNPSTPLSFEALMAQQGDAQSPANFGMEDMDFSSEPNIDFVDAIDVRQILGLTDDFLPPN